MIPSGDRGKFDLIIIGYVLQEVSSAKGRQLVIEALWQRLNDNGVMVVIEPGSPKGFRFVHSFREWVIKSKTRQEANIVAPCPNHLECPMARDSQSWCHFSQMSQKYPKTTFPKQPNEADTVNEKFSFLAVRKGLTAAQKYSSELEANTPAEKSFFWPRLVLPVMKRQKHSIVDLCTDG
jgi:ribosomal protein RSM22 (predicted rRNA methylase)